jgi:hypothetical protein
LVESVEVQAPDEFETAFAGMMRERPGALIVACTRTRR